MSSKEGSEESLITFGGYDPDLIEGTIKYHRFFFFKNFTKLVSSTSIIG